VNLLGHLSAHSAAQVAAYVRQLSGFLDLSFIKALAQSGYIDEICK